MMEAKKVYVTEKGRVELQEELERLCNVERLEIVERLQEAKTGGDWMDSAEHTLVEEELAFVEARIHELETMLAEAEIIPPDPDPQRVNVGDTVVLQDAEGQTEQYTIVGTAEANPSAGLISNECPLARALLGKQVGDEIRLEAPAGVVHYQLVAMS